MRNVKKML